jgi:hypothetical protein
MSNVFAPEVLDNEAREDFFQQPNAQVNGADLDTITVRTRMKI